MTLAEHRAHVADGAAPRPAGECCWCDLLLAADRRKEAQRRQAPAAALAAWELAVLAAEREDRTDRLAAEQTDAEHTQRAWNERISHRADALVRERDDLAA